MDNSLTISTMLKEKSFSLHRFNHLQQTLCCLFLSRSMNLPFPKQKRFYTNLNFTIQLTVNSFTSKYHLLSGLNKYFDDRLCKRNSKKKFANI